MDAQYRANHNSGLRRRKIRKHSNPALEPTIIMSQHDLRNCKRAFMICRQGVRAALEVQGGLHAHVIDVPEGAASKADCRFPYVAAGKAQDALDHGVRDTWDPMWHGLTSDTVVRVSYTVNTVRTLNKRYVCEHPVQCKGVFEIAHV